MTVKKEQIIQSAKNAAKSNPKGVVTAVLVITKKIAVESIEQFEQEILSLKGDKIQDCQFQISIEEDAKSE